MKRIFTRMTTGSATFVLTLLLAGTAWCGTISGTVAKTTAKTGRIYLQLQDQYGQFTNGTSLATTGAFTIQGVNQGTYTLHTFMDVQGAGVQHATDPVAADVVGITLANNGSSQAIGTVTLADPGAVSVPTVTPQIIQGNNGALVGWQTPTDVNGLPTVDYYNIAWSSSATGTPIAGQTSVHVPAGVNDVWVHATSGGPYYYRLQAVTGGNTANSAWVQAYTPGGGVTVTGKVYLSGVTTVTGPLMVALVNDKQGKFFVTGIASPTNGAAGNSFTINNVAAGTYKLYPILDQDNDGVISTGALQWTKTVHIPIEVTVGSSAVTAPDVTLTSGNVYGGVTTINARDSSGNSWFNLNYQFEDGLKHVVAVQLTGGPNVTAPIDLCLQQYQPEFYSESFLNSRPNVGDSYSFTVTYSDGSTENIPRPVSGIVDTFLTPTAPLANGTSTMNLNSFPLASWVLPGLPSGYFDFSTWISNINYQNGDNLPWTTTSVGAPSSITSPGTYSWTAIINDANANQSQYQTNFTATNGGPAISAVSPLSGPAGTAVTITGTGFDTTAANDTVSFNGVPATVNSATSTSLGVTVPAGAPTGPVSVTVAGSTAVSADTFTTTIANSGTIQDSGSAAISGATVTLVEDPTKTTISNGSGAYSLTTVPSGVPYSLMFTATGKIPLYTSMEWKTSNNSGSTYIMYTSSDLTGWGSTGGKGAIRSRATDASNTNLAGVTVTATSSLNPSRTFTINYNAPGSATDSTGIFTIPNVDEGDAVVVTASKAGYTFTPRTYVTHNGAVSENRLKGALIVPTISGFSPASGAPGNTVTITGTNFDPTPANDTVTFNGTTATVQSATATQLAVTVPNGATSGPISVTLTTSGQTATSGSSFTVLPPVTITGFSPANGLPGDLVTITGTNFDPNPANDTVRFNGITATVQNASTTQLVVTVPASASTGPITVSLPLTGQSAGSVSNFIVGASPAITSFSPTSGVPGDTVTIAGSNFDPTPANNTVRFNGITATVQSATATQLVVTVPNGATTGTISVTLTNTLSATSAGSFTINVPSYSLALFSSGAGTGAFTCNGTSCATSYSSGASVTIHAVPNAATSVFGGWSGACTGTGDCVLTINSNTSLTGTFNLMAVQVQGGNYFTTLSAAYAGAPNDGSSGYVNMQAETVTDTVTMNKNFNAILHGGYNGDFTSQTGTTTIVGNCAVTAGSLTADHLAVKGQVTIGGSGMATANGVTVN